MLLLIIPIYKRKVTLAIDTEEMVTQDVVEVSVSAENDVHTPEVHILKKEAE